MGWKYDTNYCSSTTPLRLRSSLFSTDMMSYMLRLSPFSLRNHFSSWQLMQPLFSRLIRSNRYLDSWGLKAFLILSRLSSLLKLTSIILSTNSSGSSPSFAGPLTSPSLSSLRIISQNSVRLIHGSSLCPYLSMMSSNCSTEKGMDPPLQEQQWCRSSAPTTPLPLRSIRLNRDKQSNWHLDTFLRRSYSALADGRNTWMKSMSSYLGEVEDARSVAESYGAFSKKQLADWGTTGAVLPTSYSKVLFLCSASGILFYVFLALLVGRVSTKLLASSSQISYLYCLSLNYLQGGAEFSSTLSAIVENPPCFFIFLIGLMNF